jgi:type II secretory pathway pseudopilin PulG
MSTLRRMRTLLIVVAILAAAALPAVAIAAHAPSRSEKQQLRAAVKASKLVQRSVRRGHFELVKPRIADSGKWAKAGVAPTNTYSDPFNAPKGLFKHGSGGWKLVKIGTTGIGCFKPKLPRSVRRELKLSCG